MSLSNKAGADLKGALLVRAREIGFDMCRIAGASAPLHASEFQEWIGKGAAGEMQWLERGAAKRSDPTLVLPGVRSVIVVAMSYWQGDAPAVAAVGGRIARYAWGDDYHDVMLEKLRVLDALLREHGGQQKCYVDTGPVLERDFGAESGVGWHGKSTMLLNAQLGTWFFLGEILTTLELAPDQPQPARCGTCTRCITACPTGAITEAHRLDARRCISYLTIELKGSIPLEFRPLIGDRIYGCDTCLDVCPWNRFATVSREAKFAARPATSAMQLRDYLGLTDEQFRVLFRGSPIKRIKRRGLLRNVCVALGNVGTVEDLPVLQRAAASDEPLIAEHARWAIERLEARLAHKVRTEGAEFERIDGPNYRQSVETRQQGWQSEQLLVCIGLTSHYSSDSLVVMHQAIAAPALSPAPPKKRRSRRKRYIVLAIVGLLLAWVITSVILGRREKPIPVVTEKAVRKTIVQTVSATGKVQPETEVKISPEVAGEITELPVEDGKAIKKGDLLMKIRPDSYKAQLEAQEAAISAARATSLQMRAATLKTEQDLRRSQDLYNKRMISESEFLAAQTAHDVAASTYDSSLHEIERAEAGSSQARDQLSKTTIYSPIDGTVTVLNSKLGERVVATNQFAGTEVMRVADLSHMEARVDVNENDVVTVKIGDKAVVSIDAYGERKFRGTVAQIANTGKTTGTGTQEEVTNFEVKIHIDDADVQLRPGLSCTADIQTNLVQDAVAVPMQSVTIRTGDTNLSPEEIEKRKLKQTESDKGDNGAEFTNERLEKRNEKQERQNTSKVVFLKKGAKAEMVKVTTGIADDTYMEIKSGVQPGDEVISGSYSAISRKLKDGAKVEFEKAEKK